MHALYHFMENLKEYEFPVFMVCSVKYKICAFCKEMESCIFFMGLRFMNNCSKMWKSL